jgi:precorrin-8X/cobalt-precorrin-8 methylmutase
MAVTVKPAVTELLTIGASPALVIGLPAGYVGAAESRHDLRASGLPALSNRSQKGGAAVAAAALNALPHEPARAGGEAATS